jgi:membrane protease YdiL (CAAX protease family)
MSKDLSFKKPNKVAQSRSLIKAFAVIIGTIGLFFFGQIMGVVLIFSLLSLFGYSTDDIDRLISDNAGFQFLAIFFIQFITIGILYWLHRQRKINFLKYIKLNKKPTPKDVGLTLLVYVVYFVTLIVSVGIISSLIPSLDVEQAQQLGFDDVTGISLIFVFLTFVVLAPVAEEIIFRGFLFRKLKGYLSLWPAVIITSFIFAVAHTEFFGDNPLNFIAAIDTFILSLFLIYLLQKTGSLWAPIFLHATKNCIAFVVLFII